MWLTGYEHVVFWRSNVQMLDRMDRLFSTAMKLPERIIFHAILGSRRNDSETIEYAAVLLEAPRAPQQPALPATETPSCHHFKKPHRLFKLSANVG